MVHLRHLFYYATYRLIGWIWVIVDNERYGSRVSRVKNPFSCRAIAKGYWLFGTKPVVLFQRGNTSYPGYTYRPYFKDSFFVIGEPEEISPKYLPRTFKES